MSWIVRDAIARERAALGLFHAGDWRTCAEQMGLKVAIIDMGPLAPALLVDGRLILDHRLDRQERWRWAWHEIGHVVLHAGNCEWWRSRPGGEMILGKMERQAWEFALTFPIWDGSR